MPRSLHAPFYLILTTAIGWRCFYYSHFTGKKTNAQVSNNFYLVAQLVSGRGKIQTGSDCHIICFTALRSLLFSGGGKVVFYGNILLLVTQAALGFLRINLLFEHLATKVSRMDVFLLLLKPPVSPCCLCNNSQIPPVRSECYVLSTPILTSTVERQLLESSHHSRSSSRCPSRTTVVKICE